MNSNVKEKNIIDVIEEFDYSTQNEKYNENFREWRKNKDNVYSFNFKKDQRERVYVDGRGFVEKSCSNAEKKVLTNIFHTLGNAILMWIVFEDVISRIILLILERLGFNIHASFMTKTLSGGCHEVAIVLIVLNTMRIVIPMFYLHHKFKMPKKAAVMSSMNKPSALVGAISAAFVFSVVTTLPSAFSNENREVLSFFGSENMDVSIWNQGEFVAYTIFDVLVIPIISQLFFCGAAFTVLRQFGDTFAMLITAFTAAVLTQDFRYMPAIFIITLVGCCGMLTSGSIFTAIAVNIIFKMYQLTIVLIETDTSGTMPLKRNGFMAAIVIAGTIGLIYFRIALKKHPLKLARYNAEMSFQQRMVHASKTFPFSAVALLCILCAIMEAFK
ncbi:MAG: CPBP family intramembrane metalloprotease [Ruminococcus sp.]|nr:CPBP family intramembrane metalloprotease [Ruminococcus sp.]